MGPLHFGPCAGAYHSRNQTPLSLKSILILQGPNLNLVGVREPSVYGESSLSEWLEVMRPIWFEAGASVTVLQSNHEGVLIDAIQEAGFSVDGIVFNPGGYTHTSVAIRDAIVAVKTPVVEVHLTNIYGREEFRQHSLISAVCSGVIGGLGFSGYDAAVRHFIGG